MYPRLAQDVETTPLPPPTVLRFERRQADRWPVEGVAVAHEVAGPGFGRRHVLNLLDRSDGGVGARSDDVLLPGTVVSVASAAALMNCEAIVLRCEPTGDGYRIALRTAWRRAA